MATTKSTSAKIAKASPITKATTKKSGSKKSK